MKQNIGQTDRILRVTAGVLMIGGGVFMGGTIGTALTVIGLVPLATGLVGNCPLYGVCKINTHHT
ncbi:MAG: DUF2892 domain-containing protein [Candidatus Nitronauta litoralis]|uniref:DUF2892 domain-containing protein n=1 Tax=Candidatus Nitronauta litoralis TaxID=2705533 RepID=A0A7T0BTN1_9BACT|nr:MAG: DUF2892 domain-containing protein [Candidatus Nitronauta litoralis]